MADKTQAEKLEALVDKAFEADWGPKKVYAVLIAPDEASGVLSISLRTSDKKIRNTWVYLGDYASVIFSHDFARALFGEPDDQPYLYEVEERPHKLAVWERPKSLYLWQYCLQQAVISDDPIGYMYGIVFGEAA